MRGGLIHLGRGRSGRLLNARKSSIPHIHLSSIQHRLVICTKMGKKRVDSARYIRSCSGCDPEFHHVWA